MEPRRRDTRSDRLSPSGSATGRALVVEPVLRRTAATADRTPEAKLDEAVGLACAIDLDVEQFGIITLNALRPATYLGKGKVDEIAGLVKTHEAGIVVM
ncbi:MAG: GTPase HflX, partial [Xanthobacteraceae bacterium]